MNTVEKIKNGLIVSCQADNNDPFNTSYGVTLFALAAEKGGAVAIRSEGLKKTRQIIKNVRIPVIGLIKSKFEDGFVKITGSERDVINLIDIGCAIIAIDGTDRIREKRKGPEFINYLKAKYKCSILADVSKYDEGLACLNAGADCIATTLSGYTPNTRARKSTKKPDLALVKQLTKLPIPVIAEGRYNNPKLAADAIKSGAWAVVVGTAITRPVNITSWFVNHINYEVGKRMNDLAK